MEADLLKAMGSGWAQKLRCVVEHDDSTRTTINIYPHLRMKIPPFFGFVR